MVRSRSAISTSTDDRDVEEAYLPQRCELLEGFGGIRAKCGDDVHPDRLHQRMKGAQEYPRFEPYLAIERAQGDALLGIGNPVLAGDGGK
jgi:hypothetical protein